MKEFIILFIIFLFSSLSFSSCHSESYNCYNNFYMDITNYNIPEPNKFTPSGIEIYSKDYVNLELVDDIISNTENCLGMHLNRECFMIYIPDDWYVSQCSGEQLFPCDIVKANGYDICEEDKGLPTNEQCPCNCRSTIQDENIIVTTPNLRVMGMSLVRMMTGENRPYDNEEIRKCIFEVIEGIHI